MSEIDKDKLKSFVTEKADYFTTHKGSDELLPGELLSMAEANILAEEIGKKAEELKNSKMPEKKTEEESKVAEAKNPVEVDKSKTTEAAPEKSLEQLQAEFDAAQASGSPFKMIGPGIALLIAHLGKIKGDLGAEGTKMVADFYATNLDANGKPKNMFASLAGMILGEGKPAETTQTAEQIAADKKLSEVAAAEAGLNASQMTAFSKLTMDQVSQEAFIGSFKETQKITDPKFDAFVAKLQDPAKGGYNPNVDKTKTVSAFIKAKKTKLALATENPAATT